MIRSGTQVKWNHAGHEAVGKVIEVFHQQTTRTIQGNRVTRDASDEQPAYLIEQEDGDQILKSSTEVERSDT